MTRALFALQVVLGVALLVGICALVSMGANMDAVERPGLGDVPAVVRQLAEDVAEVKSHLPRIGALEHDVIVTAADLTRARAEYADLRANLYKFMDEMRSQLVSVHRKLDLLLEGRR